MSRRICRARAPSISTRCSASARRAWSPSRPTPPKSPRPPPFSSAAATASATCGTSAYAFQSRPVRTTALTIPTATGDIFAGPDDRAELGTAIVNQAASQSRGWEDRALFQHKRFGITPSVGLLYRNKMGPGKLWALLVGRYQSPREEERASCAPADSRRC